VQEASYFREEE